MPQTKKGGIKMEKNWKLGLKETMTGKQIAFGAWPF